MDKIADAARAISAARLARNHLAVSLHELRPDDGRDAYRVQDAVHRMLTENGWWPVVGYKIGCTTPVMQEYLGIPNPCAGAIFQSSVHASGATLAFDDFLGVGIDCEIAVRLLSNWKTTTAARTFAPKGITGRLDKLSCSRSICPRHGLEAI